MPSSYAVRASNPGSRSGKRAELGWLLPPLAAVLILFWPALGRNRVHFFEDIPNGTYPMRVFLAESVRHGRLPLWCPYIYCGYPLLAEGQTGAFYPTNALLFLTLPGPAAFELSLMLHYLLAALGMFLFLNAVGLSPPARSIGATAFALGGYMTARLAYINLIQVAAWLPWLLLAAGRFARRPSWRRGSILALVMSAQLLAGHPQTCVYCFVAALVWFTASLRSSPRKAHAVGLGAAACVVACMVAGVQLVPTLELALQSHREGGLTLREAGLGSMQPGWLVTWVFPYFFGLSEVDRFVFPGFPTFWGGSCFWELCAYAGIAGLVLALVGACAGKRRVVFVILGMLGIVLALGKYSPLFPLLQQLPVLGWFRLPARALLLTAFGISALAGVGLDAVSCAGRRRRRIALVLFLLALGSLAVLPLTQFVLRHSHGLIEARVSALLEQRKTIPPGGEDLWSEYHPRPGTVLEQIQDSTRPTASYNSYFLALLVTAAAVVALAAYGRLSRCWAALLLLLLLGSDLCVFGARYNPTVPAPVAHSPPAVLKHLPRDEVGSSRTWAGVDTHYFLSDYHGASASTRSTFSDPWPKALQLLPTNYNVLWHIESPMGRTPLPTRRFHRLQQWLEHTTSSATAEVLDLCNVSYLVSYRATESLPQIAEGDNWHLYERPGALPRAFVLPDSCRVAFQSPLDAMLTGSLPTRSDVMSRQPEWSADVTSYGRHEVTVAARLGGPGHLVLTDAWYPGWQALADGQAVRMERAYGLFRRVALEPGAHVVQFRYRPRSIRIGALLSLLGAAIVVAGVAPAKRRRT